MERASLISKPSTGANTNTRTILFVTIGFAICITLLGAVAISGGDQGGGVYNTISNSQYTHVPKLPVRRKMKTFGIASGRLDLGPEGSLSAVFTDAGLTYTPEPCPDYYHELQKGVDNFNSWGEYVQHFRDCPKTAFNTMPGISDLLGSKDSFARAVWDCTGRLKQNCDFAPIAFDFPDAYDAWNEYASTLDPETMWVIKPDGGYSSAGILFRYTKEVRKYRDRPGYTVQEYISPPYTYRGHKFDLRIWTMVTSVDPLRIYVNKDAYPKVATSPFDPSADQLTNNCIHLTSPVKACDAGFLEEVPDRTESDEWKSGIHAYQQSNDPEVWDRDLFPSMLGALTQMYLAVYPDMVQMKRQLLEEGMSYSNLFGLGGLDVIFDSKGKAWVEEMNPNAYLRTDSNMNGGKEMGDTYLKEMFRLGGGLPLGAIDYDDRLQQAWRDFCQGRTTPCTEEQAEIARKVVDEAMTSHYFVRLFPPPDGRITDPVHSKLFGERLPNDAMQIAWIQFLANNYYMYDLVRE
eukprot:Rmarinus@m.11640